MNISAAIFPKPGDTPTGHMSPSPAHPGGIPVLSLSGDYGVHTDLQFDPGNYDDAVRYLDELTDAASGLATRIRVHQRQAALLAAVEATKHDPQAAAEIRAAYAEETS